MTRAALKDTAVVIPARNEAERIERCLTALAGQCADRTAVIVVLNNTIDETEMIAERSAKRHDLDLTILKRRLAPDQGVGTARRIGCEHALNNLPALRGLLTTDADCEVAPNWVAQTIAHLDSVDAVCGRVIPIPEEAAGLGRIDDQLSRREALYWELVQTIYARHAPGCSDILETHGQAAGASLAIGRAAYLACGGFADLASGEDRQIVRALRATGHRVRHAGDVVVQASCRLDGRAPGGMSAGLQARSGTRDYLIDDCLPCGDWLIRNARQYNLGPWPPLVSDQARVRATDLPQHIDTLTRFLKIAHSADVRQPDLLVGPDRIPTSAFDFPASASPDSNRGGTPAGATP